MRFSIRMSDSPKQIAKRQERIAAERRKLREAKKRPAAGENALENCDYNDFSPNYTIEQTPEQQAAFDEEGRVLRERSLSIGFKGAIFDWLCGVVHQDGLRVSEFDPEPPTILTVGEQFPCGFRFSNGERTTLTCESLGGRRVKVISPEGNEMIFNIPENIA